MTSRDTVQLNRTQMNAIITDLEKKIVFLFGPRQVGKTWLAKEIGKRFSRTTYLNYDSMEDRAIIKKQVWLTNTELLILDELHKMKGWKNYLKGLYDTKPNAMRILVTGSARLETYRQMGDSLAGRFFVHHLLPLSLAELGKQGSAPLYQDINRLITRGGFPEPFLAEQESDADRWRTLYTDALTRTDIFEIENIRNMQALREVFELVRHKVGSPLSYSSIARDVGISPITVKRYVELLEALYIVFVVRPYTRKISRSILKEPKVYFFDTGLVVGDAGVRFENMVAVSLISHLTMRNDMRGETNNLAYVRTKNGQEVDFALVNSEHGLEQLIEVKYRDSTISRHLALFSGKYHVPGVQLVHTLKHETEERQVHVRDAAGYLRELVC